MKILCCFKIVHDYDKVLQSDWDTAMVPSPELDYVRQIISCYDEAALETALRIKDGAKHCGETVSLSAVTIGGGDYDYFFRSLYALDFERVVQIKGCENLSFSPEIVSDIIAENIAGEGFDAILCGVQAADSCGGTTPYLLARKLGFICLSNVIEMEFHDNFLRVRRETVSGESVATVRRPAVYAVGNSKSPYLRFSTVKKRMAAAKMSAEIIDLSAKEKSPESLEIKAFSRDKVALGCVFIEGENCQDKVRELQRLCPEVISL